MANEEHVAILKQGVEVWNKWWEDNFSILEDNSADFRFINLCGTDLRGANLDGAKFNHANLDSVNFSNAQLSSVDFSSAQLTDVNFNSASLDNANLSYTNLFNTKFHNCNLQNVNFHAAFLLVDTDFYKCNFHGTIFSGIDLSQATNLDTSIHNGPSFMDTHTIQQSGHLPKEFLQGIGLANWEIEQTKLYQKNLDPNLASDILYKVHELRFGLPLQVHNLFISYAHLNTEFVNKIANSLEEKEIRFWHDTKDLPDSPAGPLGKIILKEMKGCVVLLVLSKESVSRPWVRFEMENAAKMEVEEGREVLLPIALDDAWKTYNWPIELADRIKRYNIIDFSEWQDDVIYNQRFEQVLKGLDLFYKNDEST